MVPSLIACVTVVALSMPMAALDTTVPSVSVSASRWVFSPNGDGRRDVTRISVAPDRAVDVTLTVVRAGDGASVRTLASERPIDGTTTWTWRGLDDAMRRAPDGRYVTVAEVIDPVTGTTAKGRTPLAIDTRPPALSALRVAPEPWTGSGDVHLTFRLADVGAGSRFAVAFDVVDVTGRQVRRVTDLVRERGIRSVTWNARSASGGLLPNGGYTFVLRASDEAGNLREAAPIPFRLIRPVSASVVGRVDGAGRRVALTFDDCGNPSAWSQILTALRDAKVRATFFCIGRYVSWWPNLARRTTSAGMEIGNHTWSHESLVSSPHDVVVRQIRATGDAWWARTRRTPVPYLRPPGGSYDHDALTLAGSLGYRWLVLWSVDPRNWAGGTASDIARAVLDGTGPGSIVVLHVRTATADAMPTILRGLAARNLRPVTLTELLRSGSPTRGWWPAA